MDWLSECIFVHSQLQHAFLILLYFKRKKAWMHQVSLTNNQTFTSNSIFDKNLTVVLTLHPNKLWLPVPVSSSYFLVLGTGSKKKSAHQGWHPKLDRCSDFSTLCRGQMKLFYKNWKIGAGIALLNECIGFIWFYFNKGNYAMSSVILSWFLWSWNLKSSQSWGRIHIGIGGGTVLNHWRLH